MTTSQEAAANFLFAARTNRQRADRIPEAARSIVHAAANPRALRP